MRIMIEHEEFGDLKLSQQAITLTSHKAFDKLASGPEENLRKK